MKKKLKIRKFLSTKKQVKKIVWMSTAEFKEKNNHFGVYMIVP